MWLARGSVKLRDAPISESVSFLHGAVMLFSDAG
jgi:hypothetical protein